MAVSERVRSLRFKPHLRTIQLQPTAVDLSSRIRLGASDHPAFPGVPSITITLPVLGKMFAGNITQWNDPAITV